MFSGDFIRKQPLKKNEGGQLYKIKQKKLAAMTISKHVAFFALLYRTHYIYEILYVVLLTGSRFSGKKAEKVFCVFVNN